MFYYSQFAPSVESKVPSSSYLTSVFKQGRRYKIHTATAYRFWCMTQKEISPPCEAKSTLFNYFDSCLFNKDYIVTSLVLAAAKCLAFWWTTYLTKWTVATYSPITSIYCRVVFDHSDPPEIQREFWEWPDVLCLPLLIIARVSPSSLQWFSRHSPWSLNAWRSVSDNTEWGIGYSPDRVIPDTCLVMFLYEQRYYSILTIFHRAFGTSGTI